MVIEAYDRFTDRHAAHYISLYRSKGCDEAKNWARTALAAEPRKRMVVRVNEILRKNKKD